MADEEAADDTDAPTAAVESTDLANGAKLYHDGAIVVGTTKVYNDEAMTEATADGDYDTADSQLLTVAGGICTFLGADPNAAATETPAVAKLRQDFEQLTARFNDVQAENTRLKASKPTLPAPVARQRTDAPDPKAKAKPTAADPNAGTL